MPEGLLEHVNLSVTDPRRSSDLLQKLCGWHERWTGTPKAGGHTIHVGSERQYIALYTGDHVKGGYEHGVPLNHVALEVEDLDAADAVVREAGLEPSERDNYEPGERFYFTDWDGIDWEVVSYE